MCVCVCLCVCACVYVCVYLSSPLSSIPRSIDEMTALNISPATTKSKPVRAHTLRGWQLYAYEVSWPSVLISFVLLAVAHFVNTPDYNNWHYNKHNEWAFDFKEVVKEIVPFSYVLYFGVACGVAMAIIEQHAVK